MKKIPIILGMALTSLLIGCATTPVALTAVGPNPNGVRFAGSQGRLEVFSCREQQSDDQNQGSMDPIWYQHTDYDIYNRQGKWIRHVDNTTGHYAEAPRLVTLPTGQYYVEARAAGYVSVRVPVTVARGQVTRLHLDDTWKPPTGIVTSKLVRLPGGEPVGWSTNPGQ
jgi:hypothetical protein